jgi:creatinine amidohydrolase/Fe(II)-dependent formamide hydrolase-like protein
LQLEDESMALPPGGLMEEMTWPEAAEAAQANLPVVLAIGSTEQHGPHLPLCTDCFLPQGVALEVAGHVRHVRRGELPSYVLDVPWRR